MDIIRPPNFDKVGDPVDNIAVNSNNLDFKDLSLCKSQDKPIYLENEDQWFENLKLLKFYQKYDKDSLQRFEYNNPAVNVKNMVTSPEDAKLMGHVEQEPDHTIQHFLPQLKEKVIGEGSILRFKPAYRAEDERKSYSKAAHSHKRGKFEKVYCQLTQQHLNIFLNCRDKIDSLKLLRQNYYRNFIKRYNYNYKELLEKYSRYPKRTQNIDEFLQFLAEPPKSEVKIRSIPIGDIVDMKHLTPAQLAAIGMRNSTDNIVRLILKSDLVDPEKPAPPESEQGIDKSYMNSSSFQVDPKSADILGVSGEQLMREIPCFDEGGEHEDNSTILDMMLDNDDPGTKKFETEMNLFEEFIQK